MQADPETVLISVLWIHMNQEATFGLRGRNDSNNTFNMKQQVFILVGIIFISCFVGCTGDTAKLSKAGVETERREGVAVVKPGTGSTQNNASNVDKTAADQPCDNSTGNCPNDTEKSKSIMSMINENKDMLKRTVFVLVGVTAIVVLYFIYRTAR